MAEKSKKTSIKEKFKGKTKKLRKKVMPTAAKRDFNMARAQRKNLENRLKSLNKEYKNAYNEAQAFASNDKVERAVDKVFDWLFGSEADRIQDQIRHTEKEYEEAVVKEKAAEKKLNEEKEKDSANDKSDKNSKKKEKKKNKNKNKNKKKNKKKANLAKKIRGKSIYYMGKGISLGAKGLDKVAQGLEKVAKGFKALASFARTGMQTAIQAGNACVAATAGTFGLSLIGAAACYAAAAACAAAMVAAYTAYTATLAAAKTVRLVAKVMNRVGQNIQRMGNNIYRQATNQNIAGYSPQNTASNSMSQTMSAESSMEKPSMEKPSMDKQKGSDKSANVFSNNQENSQSNGGRGIGGVMDKAAAASYILGNLSGRGNSQHPVNKQNTGQQQTNTQTNSNETVKPQATAEAIQEDDIPPISPDNQKNVDGLKISAQTGRTTAQKGFYNRLSKTERAKNKRFGPRSRRRARQTQVDTRTLATVRAGRGGNS